MKSAIAPLINNNGVQVGILNSNPPPSNSSYHLTTSYDGAKFFDGFNFFTDNDPTNGVVDYVDRQTAEQSGFIAFQNNKVIYTKR